MGIASMTGFARASGGRSGAAWTIEIRSVNNRGLDLRLRLPPPADVLEGQVRDRLTRALGRGSIALQAFVTLPPAPPRMRLNEAALAALVEALERSPVRARLGPIDPGALLAIRGVVETEETATGFDEAMQAAFLADLDVALEALVRSRQAEGERLAAALAARLHDFETLCARADGLPSRRPEAIRARLERQIAALFEASPPFDAGRLHQEAMLLAVRADVREELDRIGAHVAAARALIAEGGPVGRRLDFLAQEFGREANTLCAKAGDVDLTAVGLDLKAAVEQFREQVQNIE
jgi:uncharacterized protein (TIGR00255 family)